MARVTVEDCLERVNNRFELIMLATKRARDITLYGADPYLEWENDKDTVMALREIAAGHVNNEYVTIAEQQELTPEQELADARAAAAQALGEIDVAADRAANPAAAEQEAVIPAIEMEEPSEQESELDDMAAKLAQALQQEMNASSSAADNEAADDDTESEGKE